ncbi:DUF2071 domain-containing protein [Pontibacter flavimaris]|uniref:DUF2071 domain-containing protein n=1 Tax=Pontibacter flavimaris TaxID=1797110 RepID=A0A1Q5PCV0_9BACT|nr:DUF2071 domain-containing protein [Pontibacter flavimaris]OKL40013.1 hypothetical protein A3841_16760 [Pontibacter flavimaris]
MDMLKKLPLRYVGELHEVRLINFSVEKKEVLPFLPEGLQVRDYHGRALISMVNVKLRNMRPSFLPKALHFDYQHIGFRLLVNDTRYNEGEAKGIYFLRSFTDRELILQGGSWLTNYRLERAKLSEAGDAFELRQGEKYLRYRLGDEKPAAEQEELYQKVGALDRAYSYIGNELMRVQIMRERWPIEWVHCEGFETNFFLTARLEGAFQVRDVIHYQWLPPEPVASCALSC